MMGLKVTVVLVGCLALVAGRSMTVKQTSVLLTEDSADSDAADGLNNLLRIAFGNSDVTSDEQDGDCKCKTSSCDCCQKISKYEVCILAKRGNHGSVEMVVTIDGERYIGSTFTFPLTICGSGTGMKAKNCCLEVTKLNQKDSSACASVAFEVETKWYTSKSDCFTLPAAEQENEETVDDMKRPKGEGQVFMMVPFLKFLASSSVTKQPGLQKK